MHWSNSDLHLILVVIDSWNHRVPWLGRDPQESLSPTPNRATQNSISASESSVQMLIELYQPRAMITALGSLFLGPDYCLVKKLFLTLKFHITAPCRSLGPCRCQREHSSVLPMRPSLSSSALRWAHPGTSDIPYTSWTLYHLCSPVSSLYLLYILQTCCFLSLESDTWNSVAEDESLGVWSTFSWCPWRAAVVEFSGLQGHDVKITSESTQLVAA